MPRYKPIYIVSAPPLLTAVIVLGIGAYSNVFLISFVCLLIAIVFFMDALARYREYMELVDRNEITEVDKRYFKRSYCRRHAAKAAGVDPSAFYDMGYRWWHFLPEGAPLCFLKLSFWKSVIGVKK